MSYEPGRQVLPPLPRERTREWPYGWASIACASLAVLVPLVGYALLSLGHLGRPILRLSPSCTKSAPPLWLLGLVFGIVAIIRGDRARGIAGLVICGIELALVGVGIGIVFYLFSTGTWGFG